MDSLLERRRPHRSAPPSAIRLTIRSLRHADLHAPEAGAHGHRLDTAAVRIGLFLGRP